MEINLVLRDLEYFPVREKYNLWLEILYSFLWLEIYFSLVGYFACYWKLFGVCTGQFVIIKTTSLLKQDRQTQ